MPKLIFIYASRAGLLHDARSSWQKILGRDCGCSLCAITHGVAAEKREWKAFRESLLLPVEFLHADEIPSALREVVPEMKLPAVLLEEETGTRMLIDSSEIFACGDSAAKLIQLLRGRLAGAVQVS